MRIISYICKLIICACIITSFALPAICEEKTILDESIVTIIQEMNCAFSLTNVGTKHGNYEMIREAGLELMESATDDEGTYELFRGKGGGYLALFRKGEWVFCAQYINDFDSGVYYDEHTLLENVYSYFYRPNASGLYLGGETAFFLDGTYVTFGYGSPQDNVPYYKLSGIDRCILSRLDSYRDDVPKERCEYIVPAPEEN